MTPSRAPFRPKQRLGFHTRVSFNDDTGPAQGLPVTPHSPTLRSRIRQGSGSRDSAVEAAELGIGLISGTVQHDLAEGETFGEYQAPSIADFRAASRPKCALNPPATVNQPPGARISPVFHGTPDQVTEAVLNDPGLATADGIVLFLPPAFALPENVRLLSDLVEGVAPAMLWAPSW